MVVSEEGRTKTKEEDRGKDAEHGIRPDRPRSELLVRRRHVALHDRLIGRVGRQVLPERTDNNHPKCNLSAGHIPVVMRQAELVCSIGGGQESGEAAINAAH